VRGFQGPRSFWLRPSTGVGEQVAVPAGRPAVSADFPILAWRITAPGVPDWAVQRPRVTELIAESTRWYPLTVVTGPSGAGNTMDLALRAAAEPGTVAWVYLDDYDNQTGVFWSCLVAAPGRSGIPVPKALPTAARGQAADHVFCCGFDDTEMIAAGDTTVLRGAGTDQAALHGLLRTIQDLGLELLGVHLEPAEPA
jgi:hypothetical protein